MKDGEKELWRENLGKKLTQRANVQLTFPNSTIDNKKETTVDICLLCMA